MDNNIKFGPRTIVSARCHIHDNRAYEPDLVFLDAGNPKREIKLEHTRPDGPALERRLKQSLLQLMPLHPELLELPASLTFYAKQAVENPDGSITLTWDQSFQYDLRLTLCDTNLPAPAKMTENINSDCVYAKPSTDLSKFELICAQEPDNPNKLTPARCNACQNYKSMHIQFPISIANIVTGSCEPDSLGHKPGALVAVRPADDTKTYLGIYVGDLPIFISSSYNRSDKSLNITPAKNPAMFVFALNKLVFGAESWWHEIDSPEELKDITDNDINGQFYVQYLKQFNEKNEA